MDNKNLKMYYRYIQNRFKYFILLIKTFIILGMMSNKSEKNTIIYLTCIKRWNQRSICPIKAKYIHNTREVIVYDKFININNNHNKIDF